jgi:hypothetical protein
MGSVKRDARFAQRINDGSACNRSAIAAQCVVTLLIGGNK